MKKLKLLIFMVGIIFLNTMFVDALPNSYSNITQAGSHVYDACGQANPEDCYGVHLMVSNGTALFCTKYDKAWPTGTGATCNITDDWNKSIRYGVAAIINAAKTNINTTGVTNQYFASYMAINRFLSDRNAGGYPVNENMLSSTYKALYNEYLTAGVNAYNAYSADSAVSISLSSSELSFTLNGNNYVSNTVTVSGVDNYNVTTTVGSVSKSWDSFSISIPASSVTGSTTVSVTVTSSKSLAQARNYNCGNEYQTVTPIELETTSFSDSKTISGNINPAGKLIIRKVDENNNLILGAKIRIKGPNGYDEYLITNGEARTLEGLAYGEYTITEVEAPIGYVKDKTIKKVTLSSGKQPATIEFVNKKTKVRIYKKSAETGNFLPGAYLEIRDEEGNVVKYCGGDGQQECKWMSTNTYYEIEGMPFGSYNLVETKAPEGYQLRSDIITSFNVTDDEQPVEIIFTNRLNRVLVSKINMIDKKLLPGAVLEIQDKDGKVVKYCVDEKGNKKQECRWTSSDKRYVIKGMPAGTYYLAEIQAPNGYVLNTERVEFTVKETDFKIEVKMENDLEVEVPNTLSSRSALLLAIAMFDIALGIGIVTYVKKNKIEQ